MNALTFRPKFLGFEFRIGKQFAMIVDEDASRIWYQTDQRVRWMNKPVFFNKISKNSDGYYLTRNSR